MSSNVSSSSASHQQQHEQQQQQLLLYRSIVALNNAAVSLLARGRPEQAMTTLDDAIFLLDQCPVPHRSLPCPGRDNHCGRRRTTANDGSPAARDDDDDTTVVQRLIDQSNQRMAACSRPWNDETVQHSHSDFTPTAETAMNDLSAAIQCPEKRFVFLQVVSSQCHPSRLISGWHSELRGGSNSSSGSQRSNRWQNWACPVNIDPRWCTDDEDDNDSGVENQLYICASIVWYNYGIAYTCRSSTCDCSVESSGSTRSKKRSFAEIDSNNDDIIVGGEPTGAKSNLLGRSCCHSCYSAARSIFEYSATLLKHVRVDARAYVYGCRASQVLLLKMLLTHNLLQTSIQLRLEKEYTIYRGVMKFWLQLLDSQERFLPFNDHDRAAAA